MSYTFLNHLYRNRRAMRFFLGLVLMLCSLQAVAQVQPSRLDRRSLTESGGVSLQEGWRMKQGDSLLWVRPDYDDGLWTPTESLLDIEEAFLSDFAEVNWFRYRFSIDSTLVQVPLVFTADYLAGAMELYLDGRLLYSIGQTGTYINDRDNGTMHRPRVFSLSTGGEHVLAVRYINDNPVFFSRNGYSPGFLLRVAEANTAVNGALQALRSDSFYQYFFTGFLLAFALLHALLYAHYTKFRENLYYALFALTLAVLNYLTYQAIYAPVASAMVEFGRLRLLLLFVTGIFILRFTYSLYYSKSPVSFWVYLAVGLVLSLFYQLNMQISLLTAKGFEWMFMGLLFVSFAEVMRVIVVAVINKREGIWIIGTGLFVFMLSFSVLALTQVGWAVPEDVQQMFGAVGTISLLTAMSVYVSHNVSRTQKRLESKLWEVQHLSARSLQQERVTKEKEIERKLLEADNIRKTQELEEARVLQLSMLPQTIPVVDGLDIAVHMSTATEVGGDYYDFNFANDGVLTVAVGDVTGHGMKAGIIVATAKSYFLSLADREDNLEMLRKMSEGIRNLKLRMLYMGLTLLRYNKGHFELVAAGMPPALVYRNAEHTVEQLVLKGLPLGSKRDFPYQKIVGMLAPGDCLLLLSDGLPELFNPSREMLEYGPIEKAFLEVSDEPAAKIIERMQILAEEWRGAGSQGDDMTLVVIKREGPDR